MKVFFKTNLDLVGEQWPNDMPCIPRVGDCVESMTTRQWRQVEWRLKLKVVAVTWIYVDGQYVPAVELHDSMPRSINEFQTWYRAMLRSS